MPTYTYRATDSGEIYELFHSIHDSAMTQHPETGESLERVFTGAPAIHTKGLKKHVQVNYKSAAATACGCASNVALAQQMYSNSRETPVYGSINSKRTVHGGVSTGPAKGHSHSHGDGCSHRHGTGGGCDHKH